MRAGWRSCWLISAASRAAHDRRRQLVRQPASRRPTSKNPARIIPSAVGRSDSAARWCSCSAAEAFCARASATLEFVLKLRPTEVPVLQRSAVVEGVVIIGEEVQVGLQSYGCDPRVVLARASRAQGAKM